LEILQKFIRNVPDFPKPGILFKDISPLLGNAEALSLSIHALSDRVRPLEPTHIVSVESRGFIFGSAVAVSLGCGFVMARKPGKLPSRTTRIEYALEYGIDQLEMHADSLTIHDRVVIIDDVLATGGTAKATAQLVEMAGARVAGLGFLGELPALGGRDKLSGYNIITLMSFV